MASESASERGKAEPRAVAGIPRTTINGPGLIGPDGGRIGAVMLSPFIKPGTVSTVSYIH
jgi:hypothetical protein